MLWRRLALATLGTSAGFAAADPEGARAAAACVPRAARSLATFTAVAADFKWSLSSATEGSPESAAALERVHERTAASLLRLCRANGGIYTKAGQMLSTAQGMPPAYRVALASLQDAAPPRPFPEVEGVLHAELGAPAATLFAAFEPHAAAAASLAQVQYPGLATSVAADLLTLRALAAAALAFATPGAMPDVSWLITQLQRNLACELDFVAEGRNAERVAALFAAASPCVATAPGIVWEHTSQRVLTMRWVDGCRVDDAQALRAAGLHPRAVAAALADAVGQMAFRFGFVHGDLHPGNIRVLPAPPATTLVGQVCALCGFGPPNVRLVLLDHGLYATLAEPIRRAYCTLWQAVALGDGAAAAAAGNVLVPGTGQQWALLTIRPETLSKQQRADLRTAAGFQSAADVGEFLEGVPPAVTVAFRAQGLLRSVTMTLGLQRDARLWRMLSEATLGLAWQDGAPPSGARAVLLTQFRLAVVQARFIARVALFAAQHALARLARVMRGSATRSLAVHLHRA